MTKNNLPFRIVVLLSGRGSNFFALKRALDEGLMRGEISAVVSDKPSAPGLLQAQQWGLKTHTILRRARERSNEDFNRELANVVCDAKPDLVILAGFMRILTSEFISPLRGKIINIHPSLLPSFRGLHAQKQALDAGVKYSGCTVHVALEELDAGPILGQSVVPVLRDDTEESLSARILIEEHKLLPAIVKNIVEGNIILRSDSAGKVSVEFKD